MLTPREKKEKRALFLIVIGYFTAGYLLINWINLHRSHYFDVSLPGEENIPFIAFFIFGYILVYLSVFLLYFIIDDIEDFRRTAMAYLAVTTIHYILFLIFPVRCDMRPDLSGLEGISAGVTRFFYFIDKPQNCFPSLHMAYSVLAMLVSWRKHYCMRVIFAVMAVLVGISVILVKQHYIMDVIAGAAAALIIYAIVTKTEPIWSKLFKKS